MLIDRNENITLITQEKLTLEELVSRLTERYEEFSKDNIVVNLNSIQALDVERILEFLNLSNIHRGSNHSFVIVTDQISYDEAPDELVIVPTLQEAYDIIEMEEIERDLGF